MSDTLVELHDIVVLRQTDPRILGVFGAKPVRALDGISLTLGRGDSLGVMGGSGAGKTTLAEVASVRLLPNRGRVVAEGRDVGRIGAEERKKLRRRLQLIRQDARDSLELEQTALRQLQELLRHAGLPESESTIGQALEQVGLGPEFLRRTPLEMSGGQQQRLAIARVLVTNPALVVGDEPVSGVDVHLQMEMIRLLQRVQQQTQVAYMIISQDARVISRLTRRMAVLYAGRLMESGPTEALLSSPAHPYSRQFLGQEPGAMPPDEDQAGRTFAGCPWAGFCALATDVCRRQRPVTREVNVGHSVACHAV